jgi:isoleucyl-tRNA synthetase
MALTQKAVYMSRALRNDVQIKVRQPLQKIMVHVASPESKNAIKDMSKIICDEINVKEIVFVDDLNELANLSCKPNFKVLGKKAGKHMKALNDKIRELKTEELQSMQKEGSIDIDVDGTVFNLTMDDLEIVSTPKEDLVVSTESDFTVALDTHISEALRNEGIARELVNRIQNFRKDVGLEVTDRIILMLELPKEINEAVVQLDSYIAQETLAEKINYGKAHFPKKDDISIDNYNFSISLEKAQGEEK